MKRGPSKRSSGRERSGVGGRGSGSPSIMSVARSSFCRLPPLHAAFLPTNSDKYEWFCAGASEGAKSYRWAKVVSCLTQQQEQVSESQARATFTLKGLTVISKSHRGFLRATCSKVVVLRLWSEWEGSMVCQMARKLTSTDEIQAPDAAGPPPPQVFKPPDMDDYDYPDTPIWRKDYSYRGQPYR